MKLTDILIQLIGVAGTVMYFLSYQCRSNRRLFAVQLGAYVLYTVHFFLLGAYTGGAAYAVNAFRSLCLAGNRKFAKSRTMCIVICIMQAGACVLTFSGWISLLPCVANIAATVGGYTHDAKKIRYAGIFINSPLWIIYNIIVGSYAGILDEVLSEASMIISLVRHGKEKSGKPEVTDGNTGQ